RLCGRASLSQVYFATPDPSRYGARNGASAANSFCGACDPVATFGDDDPLHVVRHELHRTDDAFADALPASDRKNRERQTRRLALRILGDGRVDGAIRFEAAAEGVGARGQAVDVVLDDVVRQRCPPDWAYSAPK